MDLDETMVENVDETQADDTPEEELVEETDESEEDLGEFAGEQPAEEEPPKESQGTGDSEPGWFRKRWDKEVGKLTERIREEIRGEYEAQMAPLRAKMMEDEAQELVRSRKVTDIETARELVRLRNGMPAAAKPAEQPRQANGQFAPKEDPGTSTRIEMLRHQAEKIAKAGGPDVRAEFTNNEEIKAKVVSGEMDFYDVADYLKQKSSKKRPPSPMRSPNGASGQSPNAIDSMSDEQFERMEKRISEGARIRLSK